MLKKVRIVRYKLAFMRKKSIVSLEFDFLTHNSEKKSPKCVKLNMN